MNVNNFIPIIGNLLSYFFTNIFQTNYTINMKATMDLDDITAGFLMQTQQNLIPTKVNITSKLHMNCT